MKLLKIKPDNLFKSEIWVVKNEVLQHEDGKLVRYSVISSGKVVELRYTKFLDGSEKITGLRTNRNLVYPHHGIHNCDYVTSRTAALILLKKKTRESKAVAMCSAEVRELETKVRVLAESKGYTLETKRFVWKGGRRVETSYWFAEDKYSHCHKSFNGVPGFDYYTDRDEEKILLEMEVFMKKRLSVKAMDNKIQNWIDSI